MKINFWRDCQTQTLILCLCVEVATKIFILLFLFSKKGAKLSKLGRLSQIEDITLIIDY